MKVKKETYIRTILTFIALINSVLLIMGKEAFPYSDSEIYQGVSAVFAVLTTLWSWWKNNSFSKAALKADKVMKIEKIYEKG